MRPPATPPHNRKLGLLGVALVKARFPKSTGGALDSIRDEFEARLIETRFFEGAPFSWITIAIRYGLKNEEMPVFQRISTKYGDLPLAIEVDSHELISGSLEDIQARFRRAVARALAAVISRYGRPSIIAENEK
jgi:hypothetical protein